MSTGANTAKNAPAAPLASDAPVRDWVDALASGACSNVEFLTYFREQVQEDPELAWEALALLDQNFRTKRIEREVYLPIKAYLERFAVAHGDNKPTLEPQTVVPVAKQPANAAVVSSSTPAPLRIGAKLRGRYRIIGILGDGSAGTVVEAIDEMRADIPGVSQRIAIRIRDTHEFDHNGQLGAYLRHVCKIQAFSHANLTRIFDFDQDQGRLLLTMELLAGSRLSQLAAETNTARSYSLHRPFIVQCVASALQYAHSQGVAHGDFNADEVLITHDGGVRVLGLERSIVISEGGMARDYLAFASFAYDLLSLVPRSDLLQRPTGLTDGQWQSLSGVLGGNDAEGPKLLQQFSVPMTAPTLTPAPAATVAAAATRTPQKRLLRGAFWGSLATLVFLGAGYVAYDLTRRQPDLKPVVAPRAAAVTPTPLTPVQPTANSPVPEPVANDAVPAVASSPPSVQQPIPFDDPIATVATTPGTARFSTINFQREAVTVNDRRRVVGLIVQRRGATAKAVTFVWWTETGSAQPGVDFFTVLPRAAEFPAGATTVELFVPLVPNAESTQARTFFVKIDEAGAGAELGDRTLARVSIIPPGYVEPPEIDLPESDWATPTNDTSTSATQSELPAAGSK